MFNGKMCGSCAIEVESFFANKELGWIIEYNNPSATRCPNCKGKPHFNEKEDENEDYEGDDPKQDQEYCEQVRENFNKLNEDESNT